MKRWLFLFIVVTTVVSAVSPAFASDPVIEGAVSGGELCPQSICGAAIFVGFFLGTADKQPMVGFFWAAVQHESLPGPLNYSAITGGEWGISNQRKNFRGTVLSGSLFNNANKTFTVDAVLEIDRGGTGIALFSGLLDHNVFPPTIKGNIFQPTP